MQIIHHSRAEPRFEQIATHGVFGRDATRSLFEAFERVSCRMSI